MILTCFIPYYESYCIIFNNEFLNSRQPYSIHSMDIKTFFVGKSIQTVSAYESYVASYIWQDKIVVLSTY